MLWSLADRPGDRVLGVDLKEVNERRGVVLEHCVDIIKRVLKWFFLGLVVCVAAPSHMSSVNPFSTPSRTGEGQAGKTET